MEEYYYQLIQAYSENRIDERGLAELREWVEESPENLSAFRDTLSVFESARNYIKTGTDRSESAWSKIKAGIETGSFLPSTAGRKKSFRAYFAYAAAALVVILCGLFFFIRISDSRDRHPVYVEFLNPKGKRTKLILPDRSVVYLNAASRVRYNRDFKIAKKREVFLEGEAFFEVTPDAGRPFLVQSGGVSTTVLGTSFNVKAFGEEEKIVITVRTGKVGVSLKEQTNDKFLQFLLPDQQLAIDTRTGNYSFSNLNTTDDTEWKDNRIVFDNATLDEIGRSLERWYNIKVVMRYPQDTGCRFTAKFDYIPLNRLMDLMAEMTGDGYSLKNDLLIIDNKKCKQEENMD